MMFLLLLVLLLPVNIFPWFWFTSSKADGKMDFVCPHQCGQWGSESVQANEWQFIKCLYEVDRLQDYIESNLKALDYYPRFFIVTSDFISKPENFGSKWYQRLVNEDRSVVIQNGHGEYSEWAVFWSIEHINRENGGHLGKIFKRSKYDECWVKEVDPDEDCRSRKAQENNPKCSATVMWQNCIEKDTYCFKNRIDFHNACIQLEQDLWDNVQDSRIQELENEGKQAVFKSEIIHHFGKISLDLQEVRNGHDKIFEECRRLHHAPSADYELILSQFEKGNYVEGIESLKVLLGKVKLDSLDAHLASHIYSSKGSAEVETLQYDEAILSLSNAINLKPSNPDAYFERAVAYFETGQFDLSLHDYLNQGKDIKLKTYEEDWRSSDFSKGFAIGE